MAVLKTHIMGLSPSERTSQNGWFDAWDTAREAGHLTYTSKGHSAVAPRILDALVRSTFCQVTGRELVSVQYGAAGFRGKHTNATLYAVYSLRGDTPEDSLEVAIKTGKTPLSLISGRGLFVCTNGCFSGDDATMRFPQVNDLSTYLPAIMIEAASKSDAAYKRLVAESTAMKAIPVTLAGAERFIGSLAVDAIEARSEGRQALLDVLPANILSRIAGDAYAPQHPAAFLNADGTRSLDTLYQSVNYWARFVPHGTRMQAFHAVDETFTSLLNFPPAWLGEGRDEVAPNWIDPTSEENSSEGAEDSSDGPGDIPESPDATDSVDLDAF